MFSYVIPKIVCTCTGFEIYTDELNKVTQSNTQRSISQEAMVTNSAKKFQVMVTPNWPRYPSISPLISSQKIPAGYYPQESFMLLGVFLLFQSYLAITNFTFTFSAPLCTVIM